jgi:uncharacterized membrane-anchored protein YhcB (DUF1043 family)
MAIVLSYLQFTSNNRPVRLAYQPPAAVLFSQNKPANSTLLSQRISTSHQPNEQAEDLKPPTLHCHASSSLLHPELKN